MSSTMSALMAGALAGARGAAVSSWVCVGSAFSQRVSARRLSNMKSHMINRSVLFMARDPQVVPDCTSMMSWRL
jgi:hypothetical protein